MSSIKETDMLWDWDLLHIGALCKRIRESRKLTPTDIKEECGVEVSTISRNIEASAGGKSKTFQCYVEVLQSKYCNGKPVDTPISSDDAKILIALHNERDRTNKREQTQKRQCQLACVNFSDIASEQRPEELEELVAELAQEERPAFIMDPLWHTQAINGALLNLFGIDPEDDYLYRWEAWHSLATKFLKGSPIRNAHRNLPEFFPPSMDIFLKYEHTYPFLFTFQMRMLIKQIHELSEQYGYEFTRWWLQAINFNLQYGLNATKRNIRYKDQWIETEAQVRGSREVALSPEHTIHYSLVAWNPVGASARKAFDDIFDNNINSQNVYFAANYDKKGDFHVNTWPEVSEVIEEWLAPGGPC